MASGVKVTDEVVSRFNEMKLRGKEAAIFLKIENGSVVVSSTITKDDPRVAGKSPEEYHAALVAELPKNQCAFVLWDFVFVDNNGANQQKLCFTKWVPDAGKVQDKMVYASSTEGIKGKLPGFAKEVQGNDFDDVTFAAFRGLF
eukprot:c19137_g1_i1.p1 GENE.c19137_g1_i1~~c19137_g1_i1.p1  ORF type:complete len:162 (+),score=49.57 c19137_g1_i1:56-487(+)